MRLRWIFIGIPSHKSIHLFSVHSCGFFIRVIGWAGADLSWEAGITPGQVSRPSRDTHHLYTHTKPDRIEGNMWGFLRNVWVQNLKPSDYDPTLVITRLLCNHNLSQKCNTTDRNLFISSSKLWLHLAPNVREQINQYFQAALLRNSTSFYLRELFPQTFWCFWKWQQSGAQLVACRRAVHLQKDFGLRNALNDVICSWCLNNNRLITEQGVGT